MKKASASLIASYIVLVVTALPGCRTFDMDYIQKFGPFLDYSLGEWSLLESDETGFEDGAVNCRSWRVAFRDKDGGTQILAFDNAAFNQSDEAHFACFVYAKALDIAAGRIREAVAVEDGRITVEARLLTCAGVYSGAEAQTMLSTHDGLRLSVLDEASIAANPSNYALITFFHYDREAYDAALAAADSIYEALCERLGTKVNAVIEFVLLPLPLAESGKDSEKILEQAERGWIGGMQVFGTVGGKPSLSDSFPALLRKNLKMARARPIVAKPRKE